MDEAQAEKVMLSGRNTTKVSPLHLSKAKDLLDVENGQPSTGLRSRSSPSGQNGTLSGELRPRSASGMNSTLERIDEDARSFTRGPENLLCRHESLELTKVGKQNNSRLNGSLEAANRRSNLSEGFRTGFRPREFLRGRLTSRSRYRNRLVQKGGYCNISLVNVPKQRRKYFSDIFTTLVDVKWRWCLLVFSLSFLITWLLFSIVYYLIAMAHGDLEHSKDSDWEPCIRNGHSYLAILIFSIASQHTIGWGYRYPTEECPEVIFTICIQSMVGVMIQTLMDGKLCLLCRVGDMRKSPLAEAHVRMQLIRNRVTAEGELLPFHQYDMNVGFDAGTDRVFVIWPITICHIINEESPLYDLSKEGLADSRFEVVVILEGVVESTGATTQARTSYLPSEIQWGSRFEKLVTYQRENGNYRIDFGKFHDIYPINTTEYSAKELDEMRRAGLKPEDAFKCDIEEAENMGVTPCSTIHRGSIDTGRPLLAQIFEKRLRELAEHQDSNETV